MTAGQASLPLEHLKVVVRAMRAAEFVLAGTKPANTMRSEALLAAQNVLKKATEWVHGATIHAHWQLRGLHQSRWYIWHEVKRFGTGFDLYGIAAILWAGITAVLPVGHGAGGWACCNKHGRRCSSEAGAALLL